MRFVENLRECVILTEAVGLTSDSASIPLARSNCNDAEAFADEASNGHGDPMVLHVLRTFNEGRVHVNVDHIKPLSRRWACG